MFFYTMGSENEAKKLGTEKKEGNFKPNYEKEFRSTKQDPPRY